MPHLNPLEIADDLSGLQMTINRIIGVPACVTRPHAAKKIQLATASHFH
jgi:hypothetical protein